MKFIIISLMLALFSLQNASAKEWTLESLRQAAKQNSILQEQNKLYKNSTALKESSLSKAYLPQLSIDGQATYQSDVFDLPISIPGFQKPTVPKDQYQIALNVNQVLWDGGSISAKKDINLSELEFTLSQNDANLSKSNDVINQLYFSAKLLDENRNIIESSISQMQQRLKQLESIYKNGALLSSNLKSMEIEILRMKQNVSKIEKDKAAVMATLASWIGESDANSISFKNEDFSELGQGEFNRSDLESITKRQDLIEANKKDIYTNDYPKFFAFGKLGYGSPNPLNFFETSGSFYMLGLKMQWNIWNWNNSSRSEEILDINSKVLDNEKTNLMNTLNRAKIKFVNDIAKNKTLMTSDDELIKLQEELNKSLFSQVTNGTMTTTDYLAEETKLLQAQLNKKLHEIELEKAIVDLNTLIINN